PAPASSVAALRVSVSQDSDSSEKRSRAASSIGVPIPGFIAFFQLFSSISGSSRKRKSTLGTISDSTATRLCASGATRAKTSRSKFSAGQGASPPAVVSQGSQRSMKSSVSRERMRSEERRVGNEGRGERARQDG